MEANEKTTKPERTEKDVPMSKVIRAGKRTYFFDVKTTLRNDFYLTITESKKKYNRDGRFIYEKHIVYLYKEDFDVFIDGLSEIIGHVKTMRAAENIEKQKTEHILGKEEVVLAVESDSILEEAVVENFVNVDFEDLDDKKGSN
jgi:hypothetical protein